MRGHLSRRALALAAMMALALTGTLAGCGKDGGTQTVTTLDPTVGADKQAPPEVADVWPLTGVSGDVVARPALAVKIENSPQARPQQGLEDADMVWEEIVEGGISRYIAVYNSLVPEAVGPVRSIRPMDGPIIGPTKGVLAFSGGNARFIAAAKDAGLVTLGQDQGAKGFFRQTDRRAPHNTFARTEDLLAQAGDNTAPPPPQFRFAASAAASTPSADGEAALSVALTMSGSARPSWTWDPAESAWLRSEGQDVAVSAAGVRLSAANVVAIMVEVRNAGGQDAAGNPVPESIVVGTGTALVAADGKTIDAAWSKDSPTAPLALKNSDGKDITLSPGTTWVELIPSGNGSWSVGR